MNTKNLSSLLWDCEQELGVRIDDLDLELQTAVVVAKESERHFNRACMGLPDFEPIIFSAFNYSRCFAKMVEDKEYIGSLVFIRALYETLLHLYADSLYPNRVLFRIYFDGCELNEVTVNHKKLKPSEIRQKLDEEFAGMNEIYQHYNHYIHPSKNSDRLNVYSEEMMKPVIEKAVNDVKYINKAILLTLLAIKKRLLGVIAKKGLIAEYESQIQAEAYLRDNVL